MAGSPHDTAFDPYAAWLGIEAAQRPPTYYQLLEIEPSESRAEVIADAAKRQIEFVETKKSGVYEGSALRLLDELAAARNCLLNPAARLAYDAALRQPMPQPALPTAAPQAYVPPVPLPAASLLTPPGTAPAVAHQ